MRYMIPLAIILGHCLAPSAAAQTHDQVLKGVEECKALSVDFMRTACLEAADRFLQNTPAPTSDVPPTSRNTALEAERLALAKERAELEQARAELEAKDAQASENERLGVLARLGLTRGAADSSEEDLAATLTITRAAANRAKLYTLWTSDGDILVQQSGGRRMRLPDSFPASAVLKRSGLGSKWITFSDNPSRSYKVKVHERD